MPWTLVTGGAKGLGGEVCKTLAKQGKDLVVHYRSSRDAAIEIVRDCQNLGVQVEMIQGDFTTVQSTMLFLTGYLEKFPHTSGLVNNVGNYVIKPTLETTIDEWLEMFQSNAHVPFLLSRGLTPSLMSLKGAIVNLGVAGLNGFRADSYASAYFASKHALLSLTKSMAKELASFHVRVNMVSPGYINNARDLPSHSELLPMSRAATEEEVAQLVVHLLSNQTEYITGQNIEIAGGIRL